MKNKFLKKLLITASVCAMLPINCFSANAGNSWDSPWAGGTPDCDPSFSYCASRYARPGSNGTGACSVRTKTDTTSIYVYNKSNKNAVVKVWGENNLLTYKKTDVTTYSNWQRIPTNRWSVPKNSERFIPQYIGERKDTTLAHVHFVTGGTSGVWSADSVNWYPNADSLGGYANN